MPASQDTKAQQYGPAVTAAIKTRRAEPRLAPICRAMLRGILAHEWVTDPAVAAYLGTLKPQHREKAAWKLLAAAEHHMAREQDALARRYAEVTGSARFAALPMMAQLIYMVLYRISGDPELGGPDVLASCMTLIGTIFKVFGKKYSSNSVPWAWKCLRDAGFLTVTSGVAFEGFDQAEANVYHLLPDDHYVSPVGDTSSWAYVVEPGGDVDPQLTALIRRSFRESIERLRALKKLYLETGRKITDEDMYTGGTHAQPVTIRPRPGPVFGSKTPIEELRAVLGEAA